MRKLGLQFFVACTRPFAFAGALGADVVADLVAAHPTANAFGGGLALLQHLRRNGGGFVVVFRAGCFRPLLSVRVETFGISERRSSSARTAPTVLSSTFAILAVALFDLSGLAFSNAATISRRCSAVRWRRCRFAEVTYAQGSTSRPRRIKVCCSAVVFPASPIRSVTGTDLPSSSVSRDHQVRDRYVRGTTRTGRPSSTSSASTG